MPNRSILSALPLRISSFDQSEFKLDFVAFYLYRAKFLFYGAKSYGFSPYFFFYLFFKLFHFLIIYVQHDLLADYKFSCLSLALYFPQELPEQCFFFQDFLADKNPAFGKVFNDHVVRPVARLYFLGI